MTERVQRPGWLALLTLLFSIDAFAADSRAVEYRSVVALAPHLTEMVFALGAESRLVGVSAHSDFPPAAQGLPQVGDAVALNYEALFALRPDLVLVWLGGGGQQTLGRLRALGLATFASDPHTLDDVADELLALGRLLGRDAAAREQAAHYRQRLASVVRAAHETVFVQLSSPELYTASAASYLGEAVRTCGLHNVFAGLSNASAMVSREAVLAQHPQRVLLFDQLPQAEAVRWQQLGIPIALMPTDLLSRPGPRLAEGVAVLCQRVVDAQRAARLAGDESVPHGDGAVPAP